jgi:predicted RNase H-like HicB family nuclease
MNKARRKELSDVIKGLNSIQDKDDLYSWINTLDNIKDDEQDYYDNIPENLQSSQRAEDSEQAIEYMEEALDLLNEAYDMDEFDKDSELIQEAIDKIEDASW